VPRLGLEGKKGGGSGGEVGYALGGRKEREIRLIAMPLGEGEGLILRRIWGRESRVEGREGEKRETIFLLPGEGGKQIDDLLIQEGTFKRKWETAFVETRERERRRPNPTSPY